jgi:hypothetical protein
MNLDLKDTLMIGIPFTLAVFIAIIFESNILKNPFTYVVTIAFFAILAAGHLYIKPKKT